MIPVRVPASMTPVLANERRFTVQPDHPLRDYPCPACDFPIGGHRAVLVLAGTDRHDRNIGGYSTGAAVAVHVSCAGVPEDEPETPRVTVTFDITDPDDRHVVTQAFDDYQAKQDGLAVDGDNRDKRIGWAVTARRFRDRADEAAG